MAPCGGRPAPDRATLGKAPTRYPTTSASSRLAARLRTVYPAACARTAQAERSRCVMGGTERVRQIGADRHPRLVRGPHVASGSCSVQPPRYKASRSSGRTAPSTWCPTTCSRPPGLRCATATRTCPIVVPARAAGRCCASHSGSTAGRARPPGAVTPGGRRGQRGRARRLTSAGPEIEEPSCGARFAISLEQDRVVAGPRRRGRRQATGGGDLHRNGEAAGRVAGRLLSEAGASP